MKKASLGVILLLSLPAMAQRMNECPRPGQILNTDYTGETSDRVSTSHRRQGDHNIPVDASFNGSLRTKIYKNFRDRVCRSESYIHQERICDRISPDLALGRGNQVLHSLYNLNTSAVLRADNFSRNLRFQTSVSGAERLESGRMVVNALTKDAALRGIPRSWEEFTVVLQAAVAEGSLQQFLVDEITLTHAEANKRALGFVPLPGAIVNEGRGNGRLNQLFDLGLSPEHRAKRIEKLITGVNLPAARALSQSIIIFASSNGIPSNWNQFALMMKDSRIAGAITERQLYNIVVENEDVNRNAMGFDIEATVCRIENQTRHHNVIRIQDRRNLDREVSHGYQITVTGAPLANGEVENFSVYYDGFKAPTLSLTDAFNSYRVSQSIEGNSIKFNLEGSRKLVKPANTLNVKLTRKSKVSTLQLQNTNFNPKVGEKVTVRVKFYNSRFLRSDKLLATETYELTDGNLKTITAAIKSKDVDYVQVSMQISGSSYYNNEFSDEVKAKD